MPPVSARRLHDLYPNVTRHRGHLGPRCRPRQPEYVITLEQRFHQGNMPHLEYIRMIGTGFPCQIPTALFLEYLLDTRAGRSVRRAGLGEHCMAQLYNEMQTCSCQIFHHSWRKGRSNEFQYSRTADRPPFAFNSLMSISLSDDLRAYIQRLPCRDRQYAVMTARIGKCWLHLQNRAGLEPESKCFRPTSHVR